MAIFNLKDDDAEFPPTPTSKANWIPVAFCVIFTFYAMSPFSSPFNSFARLIGQLLAALVVLGPGVLVARVALRYPQLREGWGAMFLVGWILGYLTLIGITFALFYRR